MSETKPRFMGWSKPYIDGPTWTQVNRALEGVGRVLDFDGDTRRIEVMGKPGWARMDVLPTFGMRISVQRVRVIVDDEDGATLVGVAVAAIDAGCQAQVFDIEAALASVRGGRQ